MIVCIVKEAKVAAYKIPIADKFRKDFLQIIIRIEINPK